MGFDVLEVIFFHLFCCAEQTFTQELVNFRDTNSPLRGNVAVGAAKTIRVSEMDVQASL